MAFKDKKCDSSAGTKWENFVKKVSNFKILNFLIGWSIF